jgi:hypothetical protein
MTLPMDEDTGPHYAMQLDEEKCACCAEHGEHDNHSVHATFCGTAVVAGYCWPPVAGKNKTKGEFEC